MFISPQSSAYHAFCAGLNTERVADHITSLAFSGLPLYSLMEMIKQSAGLLVYRETGEDVEVFLVHPGGPFFAKKDDGVWSIPKGEFDTEDSLTAARREFEEETGQRIAGNFFELKPVKQKGGKIVHAWAVEADIDANSIQSNTFTMEWPPKSGKMSEFPEIDRAAWFDPQTAHKKINPAQSAFITELLSRI